MTTESPQPAALTDPPKEGQTVSYNGVNLTTIKEGLAHILVPFGNKTFQDPKEPKDGSAPVQQVFYNPIQQFNRDLSSLAVRVFGEDLNSWRTLQKLRSQRRHKPKRKNKATEQRDTDEPLEKKRRVGAEVEDVIEAAAASNGTSVQNGVEPAELADQPEAQDEIPDEELIAIEQSITQQAPGTADSGKAAEQGQQNASTEENQAAGARPAPINVLDALSATGLRALRYAQEMPFPTRVTANDLSPKAVEEINMNIQHNRLQNSVKTATGNAMGHMYQFVGQEGVGGPGRKYDVIDLDPYGTAVPFLDSTVQALSDGGLACVTCTDSAVFAGTGYPEKTFALYGGMPSSGVHCHEVGIRLILNAIATSAARYGLAIEPMLSLSIDYYIRVFVKVRKSPAEVKFLASKTMNVWECDIGCGAYKTQHLARSHKKDSKKGNSIYKHSLAQGPTASPLCEHCGSKTHVAGPMWGGPLHNATFIDRILKLLPSLSSDTYATIPRIQGMLTTAMEELLTNSDAAPPSTPAFSTAPEQQESLDEIQASLIPSIDPAQIDHHPFYFAPSKLAKVLHCQCPSEAALRGALRHAGYVATRTHEKPGVIRTDAPWSAIWEIMREWVKHKAPIKEGALREGGPGWNILRLGQKKGEGDDDAEAGEENEGNAGKAEGKMKVVFDEKLGMDPAGKKLKRFQQNPRPNWGPMSKAK